YLADPALRVESREHAPTDQHAPVPDPEQPPGIHRLLVGVPHQRGVRRRYVLARRREPDPRVEQTPGPLDVGEELADLPGFQRAQFGFWGQWYREHGTPRKAQHSDVHGV